MARLVQRSREEPARAGATWEERWRGDDRGLVTCWEVGRALAAKQPELAERAKRGELPVLGWKGGVERKLTVRKYGTRNYLAQWQGLRGNDLDIDLDHEYELTCAHLPVHEALDALHDAMRVGLLDLDPVFGDEDEVANVEQDGTTADFKT